ncbi:iron-sulfur cluster biosynthesis family protein [Paenibacillus sp. FA6]|uniref:iron-sulfur cluster biosynthesis family protein n=1 Tax=Paenibacillus sp. FA6 TaxID=3413029 RepID=UPI003F65A5B6
MNIQVTPLAKEKLKEALGDQPGYFKLFFDTVGCGCDGITVLLIMSQPDIGDIEIEASSLPFLINPQHEIYYEDVMSLDVDPNFPSYKLSSNSTIYSSNVKTRDIR